jgi:hypothetical protein
MKIEPKERRAIAVAIARPRQGGRATGLGQISGLHGSCARKVANKDSYPPTVTSPQAAAQILAMSRSSMTSSHNAGDFLEAEPWAARK